MMHSFLLSFFTAFELDHFPACLSDTFDWRTLNSSLWLWAMWIGIPMTSLGFLIVYLVGWFLNTCFHMFKDLLAQNTICCWNDKHMASCRRLCDLRGPAACFCSKYTLLACYSCLKFHLKEILDYVNATLLP
jgi:hypothetical protein